MQETYYEFQEKVKTLMREVYSVYKISVSAAMQIAGVKDTKRMELVYDGDTFTEVGLNFDDRTPYLYSSVTPFAPLNARYCYLHIPGETLLRKADPFWVKNYQHLANDKYCVELGDSKHLLELH